MRQLRSHSCTNSNVGSTHPSCVLLIYNAEETCVCVHRPVVAANYAAAASWAAAAAAPDAYFPVSAAAAASPICVWLALRTHSLVISCVPSHAPGEITATGNFTYMQTLVDSERFLIDDWGDHLYEYTFSALRKYLPFGHVLDRATLEGQKQHVHTRVCPSNLAMGWHLLRTVKCRGNGNCGYTTLFLTQSANFVDRFVPTQQFLPLSFASGVHLSKLDGAINLGDIFHFNTRLLSCVFLVLHVHAHLYSRCTGVCICTCALRQTPHEHMRIGVLGSVCVCMYSVCALRLRITFPVSCTPCSGIHCRATRPQHSCAFLITAYATLPYSLLVQATKYEHPNSHIRLLKRRVADVLVGHVTAGLSGRTIRTE